RPCCAPPREGWSPGSAPCSATDATGRSDRLTSQDTPQEPQDEDAATPQEADVTGAPAEPADSARADSADGAAPADPADATPSAARTAAERAQDAATRAQEATAKAADELKDRPRKLFDSLSARARGAGWEKPTGEFAKYRSGWRAGTVGRASGTATG